HADSFPQVLFPWLLLWIANCVLPEPRGISGSMKIGRTILIAVSESCCSPAKENRLTGAKVIGACLNTVCCSNDNAESDANRHHNIAAAIEHWLRKFQPASTTCSSFR